MLISRELATAFNQQIGNEFGASMQYVEHRRAFQPASAQLLAKLSSNRPKKRGRTR